MARKFDIDAPSDSSSFRANKNNARPFYDDDETEEESQPEEEIEEETPEETYESAESTVPEDNGKKNNTLLGNVREKAKEAAEEKAKGEVKKVAKSFFLKKALIPILIITAIIIVVVILVALIAVIAQDFEEKENATGGYYAMRCNEVTVIMTDKSNNYAKTGTKTYSLDDYIAGVISAEVGGFNNLDIYKTFAIAARSYLLTHDDNCTIESSDRKQVFRPISASQNPLIYQAVKETAGQVFIAGNGIYGSEYDAFCTISVDKDYYTLKQQNQKIPRSWADSQSGINSSWKQGTCSGNHGRGISQWGSYYLATQNNYNYKEIIKYYLGDIGVKISSSGFMSSIPGLVLKNTTNGQELHESLSTALARNGSSVSELNNHIRTSVRKNGAGTREGVVTAAVTLVNDLNNYGIRIPYYWGGNYQTLGVNPNFGAYTKSSISRGGTVYNYAGFDCSGFVSWAIRNGGYNFSRHSTATFGNAFSADSCDISSRSCVGKPGDLINSASCHVQLIVGVNEANGKYYVAESTGNLGLVIREWGMHSGNCGNTATRILHMDSFYENRANVDGSY